MSSIISNFKRFLGQISPHTALNALTYTIKKPLAESKWGKDGRQRHGLKRLNAFIKSILSPNRCEHRQWRKAGRVTTVSFNERGGCFTTENGVLDVNFYDSDVLEVKYRPFDTTPNRTTPALDRPIDTWSVPDIQHIHQDEAFLFVTKDLVVGITFQDAQVIIADTDGVPLRVDVDMAYSRDGAVRHRTALAPQERLFGLGERATGLNHRGRTHNLWNTDPKGYSAGDDPLYLNIPLYVSVQEIHENAHASSLVFYDNPTHGRFDLGDTVTNTAQHHFMGGELHYYFISGPVPHLIERYTALTGRHHLVPIWMLGYQQSRWSYDSSERLRKLASAFQKHRVPCDVFYLDIDYMDDFKTFTTDKQRFNDLPALTSDLHSQGIKLISIIDPGVKKEVGYAVYDQGVEENHFCTYPDGSVFYAPVWGGQSAFPDFSSPATRAWWGHLHRGLVDKGITGFWNDMNEPAVFLAVGDPTLPDIVQHASGGDKRNHDEVHNIYGLLMAQATSEGLRGLQQDKRPVVITRSGWAGIQRYATSWTGDNQSDWSSLGLTIPMLINLGLSGVGFTGADVGGFIGEPDGELFTRWIQMAAFMPYFRSHTAKGFPDQEPWSYGEPYLSIVRRFIELRYELLPYLYTATWQMYKYGWPMVRPIWWEAPTSEELYELDDQFMCGDKLLIAPVTHPNNAERKVILPDGEWYDFWTNKHIEGNQVVNQFAPLEIMPMFVKAGSILTLGEIGANVENRNQKFLRLEVYPLQQPGTSSSILYEDAGDGLAYLDGDFCLSDFSMRRYENNVTITWHRQGDFHPPYEHIAMTLNGLRRVPKIIKADGVEYPIVSMDPVRYTVLAGLPIFNQLEIQL